MTVIDRGGQPGAACIGLVGLGLFLQRRVYALFGGLGIALYLHHLAERVFADSLLYPLALSLIGLAVIGARLLLHRHAAALQRALQDRLPSWLAGLRPLHARWTRGGAAP